jgi:regulator of protease activity HflC (stomatin/prohibitin superfamily)
MLIYTVPQGHCMIVERFGKPIRVAQSGLHVLVPILDHPKRVGSIWGKRANKEGRFIELTEQYTNTKKDDYFTKDNVKVNVDAQFRWRILDPLKAVYEVDELPTTLDNLILAEIRSFVGANELNFLLTSRKVFSDHVVTAVADSVKKWGITIVGAEIQRVNVDNTTQDAMRQQLEASRRGEAMKLAAEAEAQAKRVQADAEGVAKKIQAEAEAVAQVRRAEGEAEAKIKQAEADSKAILLRAQAESESVALRAEGERKYMQALIETIGADAAAKVLLAQKTFEAYQRIADGHASKVYMPMPASPNLVMLDQQVKEGA